jgi:hypothetical protein
MTLKTLSRREAGALMMGSAGALAATSAVAAGGTGKSNAVSRLPTDPREIMEALVRIYGTTGPKRVTWKTRITVYAVQPAGVTPLIGLRGSESSWWTRKDESTWVRYSSTLSFFEDLQTRQFIEEFRNPLNGHVGKLGVSFIRHKEGEYFTPMGEYFGSMKKAFPAVYPDEPLTADWDMDAGMVRLRGASNFPPILRQPTKETATLVVRAAELFDKRVETPEATVSGWNIRPWEPFLGMGDAPGHVIWHFDGVKLTDVEQLDADYLARARAHTPLFDRSPQFDEGPSFFERVIEMRGRKPQG